MTRHPLRITDDEAKRLWQRAAELQEEAERAASRGLNAPAEQTRLSLEHVTQAAEGAGINPTFVLMALAEQQLPDASEIRRESRQARWLRGLVSDIDSIEVSRLVRAPADAVIAALRAVAEKPAFNLLLENTVGVSDDPADRVLVFRAQYGVSEFGRATNMADVRVLIVSLRSVAEGTHVRVRAPLFRRGVNLTLAGIATALGGVGGSWSGWSLAALVAGAIGLGAGSAFLVPAGIGALAGGALGLGGFRSLYHALVRQGTGAITTFLSAVALEAESSAAAAERSPDR